MWSKTRKGMMQVLQEYEGYLEEGRFYPIGLPLNIHGRCRVIVTVLDDLPAEQEETEQAAAWRMFFEAVNSSDEEIPDTFERVNFTREDGL